MGILPDWMLRTANAIQPLESGEKRRGVVSYGLSSYGYDARIGYKFKVFTPVHCGIVDPKAFDEKSFVEVDLTPNKHDFGRYITEDSRCIVCNSRYIDVTAGLVTGCERPDHILIPPNSFVLGETVETFNIPRDCLAVVLGKSTYARCGIIVNVTPLEPEWRGKVTVEISNTAPLPAKVYAGEGIMQILFFRSDGLNEAVRKLLHTEMDGRLVHTYLSNVQKYSCCETSYADKQGRYQNQAGIALPCSD